VLIRRCVEHSIPQACRIREYFQPSAASTGCIRSPPLTVSVKIHILGIAPIVTALAAAGHTSLAEISTEVLLNSLPSEHGKRHWAERGLRSLFGILRGRKVIFADPTRGITLTDSGQSIPLP